MIGRLARWAIGKLLWRRPIPKADTCHVDAHFKVVEPGKQDGWIMVGDEAWPVTTDPDTKALLEDLAKDDVTDIASGGRFTSVEGQPGVRDITNLDSTDVEQLREVYGPAGAVPDAKLGDWAREATDERDRKAAIDMRLGEIEALPTPEVENTGYIPVAGPSAGTDAKHGIVLPPAVKDQTTQEWVDLRLERDYGPAKQPSYMPHAVGLSMRLLNALRNRAEARDTTLSAWELYLLRSRGLV